MPEWEKLRAPQSTLMLKESELVGNASLETLQLHRNQLGLSSNALTDSCMNVLCGAPSWDATGPDQAAMMAHKDRCTIPLYSIVSYR